MHQNTDSFLVLNPGSSSEKISLYFGTEMACSLHFEGVVETSHTHYICTLIRPGQEPKLLDTKWSSLQAAFHEAKTIFTEAGFADLGPSLTAILVRVVAAGQYFAKSHLLDDATLAELEAIKLTNPLHASSTLRAVQNARDTFPDTPIILISDSEFLNCPSRRDALYALPDNITQEFDLGRWGAHGASYGYLAERLAALHLVHKYTVVCHLGSGCSVTALQGNQPVYTSMGETPLEGLMSSTRTGSIDPTIGALLGEKLGAAAAIKLMNKASGLLALAGTSDLREIIARSTAGDPDATTAYQLFIDGIVGTIGEFAAKMSGIDAIVFSATIGERSAPLRSAVIAKLGFLGFRLRADSNDTPSAPNTPGSASSNHATTPADAPSSAPGYVNLAAPGSKPIYVIPTDEATYMVQKAQEILAQSKKFSTGFPQD